MLTKRDFFAEGGTPNLLAGGDGGVGWGYPLEEPITGVLQCFPYDMPR